ncbi:hypothetical protein ASD76_13860 [Altererythrobacter sp. Root672]|nr:hypothetical protein ASD76_13860 [Altererythrobacter sp. Root672]
MFERLFLASLALSLVGFAISYQAAVDALTSDPAMQQLGIGGGLIIGAAAVGYAIYLGLWYLIAHKAANWAKWVLVVFVALGLTSLRAAFSGSWGLTTFLNLAVYGLELVAVAYLFKADAKAWLSGEDTGDPATFE